MLTAGVPWREILTRLATAGENLAGHGASVSILILDENGLLRNGASPNLPQDYLQAIDRLKPDAKVGTCAAAAATGLMVMTPDFFADDRWAELRHLPLALGFVGGLEHADHILRGKSTRNVRHLFPRPSFTYAKGERRRVSRKSGGGGPCPSLIPPQALLCNRLN